MILNIELNNENAMFNLENEDKVKTLTDELRNELLSQWRDFIKNKYAAYEEVNKIYNNETIDLNNDLVEKNKIKCQNSNSKCDIDLAHKSVIFYITEALQKSWGNQINYYLVNISNYTIYTVEFDAKVPNPTAETLTFQFQENMNPYRNYLVIKKINSKTEFKHYIISG